MTLSNKMFLCVLPELVFAYVVTAVQPPQPWVLLTYEALGCIIGGYARTVDCVFARGEERIVGEAPSMEKLSKFKDVDYYVTIGVPIEKKIEKTLLELNPRIKVFVATNDCHLIEHNHYLWYSARNLEKMYCNCHEALDPERPYMACMSVSAFAKHFEREKMTVGVTHEAFEYWCRFLGIRYVMIPEKIYETSLLARNIRIIYKARRGIGVNVMQMAETGVVVVEADPFESFYDLHIDLLGPYREVLRTYRLEEEEKEWERKEKESVRKEQHAKSESETNLCFPKTSALRSSATDVIEK